MKHLWILTMICILTSGCSIFKKSSTEKISVENSVEFEQRNASDLEIKDKSTAASITTSTSNKLDFQGYKVKADRIKFDSDGTLEADGNVSLSGFHSNEKSKRDSSNIFNQSNLEYSKSAKDFLKEDVKYSVKTVDKSTAPSGKGIIWGSVGFLIIVLGLLWWFGVKKKE